MSMRQALRQIFPPPRRPVTVWCAWPLALFLGAFGATCLYVEARNLLLFAAPAAFLLLPATPWIWWMSLAGGGGGLSGPRATVALLVRLCLAGVFILALAEPRAVRQSDALSIIYTVDLSDSIGEKAADAGMKFVVETVKDKPERDRAGLVVFGRDAAVELPPRVTFPFEAVNSRLGKDGTNIEKGLSLAAAMLPEESQGRLLLISDGTSTDGNLATVLDELVAREIPVDVLPIAYQYEHEVWLEKLELPKTVKAGETYEAAVVLSSLQAGAGTLTLRENDTLIFEGKVDFTAGKNRYVLPLYLREPGYYEYVAHIAVPPGRDGWAENNDAINHLYLKGEGKVLLVTDPAGDARDWTEFARSLKRAEREVEQRPAFEFPRDALSLLPYDCIVFANVAADAFDGVQLQAVKDAVFNLGCGFLMLGGKNSYGPGGYHRTPVEEALPVTMDISQKKVLPKGALAIILHTCEFPEGNEWAKRITKEALRVLGAKDEVGVLDYDYGRNRGEGWVFPLTPAGEYQRLVTLINQAQPGDMPSFQGTMRMGLDGLKASDAATKHMIIISDGDPSPPTPALVQEFIANKVSVSMVAIYPHGGMEISVMKEVASATGGRYYFPQDPNQLPSIFIKEAKTLRRSMIQNEIFTPRVDFPSPILKGIEEIRPLKGYVLTTAKPRTTVILKGPEKDELDPVLATWRFGVGKSAAFTSDLSPNWGADWVGWDKYDAFVKQLLIDLSRVEEKSDLQVRSFAEGNHGLILAQDYNPRESFLQIDARVSGPQGRRETVSLKQVAPGRYQAEFPLWGKGRYQLALLGSGDGRTERATGGFAVPYSPEYLRFRSNPAILEQIAQKTGGRVLTGGENGKELFLKERKPRKSSRPVWDWFLIALGCLIPLDVGLRRVQIDWSLVRGWFRGRRRTEESDRTLGALLERKKAIQFAGGEKPAPRPMPATPVAPIPRATPAAPSAPVPKPEPPPAPADDASTTGRLLAAKKKWKKDSP